ncbi:glycosyltransferase family 4 protein [Paenibacillus koleovorans]|uniref:glycosyltransferase family 4 protein n=1 Tax=Paenibacillus koleovorans TaxID=121608 RepID=UPI000FDC37F3|nr:glycosyltransferase family 1 protein [Paenibacillus koleovorans]
MKVALFTDTFLPDVNGVARTLGRWTAYLENRGVSLRIFAPQSSGAVDAGNRSTDLMRFFSIPFLLYPECKLAIPNPNRIRQSLEQFQPDLIHVATPFNLGLYGQRYAHRHYIPLVASYHTHFDQYLSFYKIQWAEPMLWKYMHWFHQSCRAIYVPSQSTLEHLDAKGFEKLEIWSRGVDVSRFHPMVDREAVRRRHGVGPDKFVYLYVGRVAPEKSVDVLLEAFELLPARVREQSHLLIAGDGPQRKELEEVYRDRGNVTFIGFLEGKALTELYAAADVFWFPSATETFGNVVLESMASGTAVIGAAAGGVRDNIQHEETGLLCSSGDVVANRDAALRLFYDRDLLGRLSRQGRAYSLKQSWESVFDKLYESYCRVLGGTRAKKVESSSVTGPKIGLR